MDEQLVDAHVRALIELPARLQGPGQAGVGTAARGARREICEQIAPDAYTDANTDANTAHAPEEHGEHAKLAGVVERQVAQGDPLLATLAQAAARREAADGLIRLLVAYAREVVPGRYPLTALAKASGISPSGLRTSYSPHHLDLVHQMLAEVDDVEDGLDAQAHTQAGDHAGDGAGDGAGDHAGGGDAGPGPVTAGGGLDTDLATVTSLLDRLAGAAAPGGARRGGYLSEEQLRDRLREILLGDD